MQRAALISVLTFAFSLSQLAAQCTGSLDSTYANDNACRGNMFDVVAVNTTGVTVTGFDMHAAAGSWTAEVYMVTAGGSALGLETIAGAWTLLGSTPVTGNGAGTPTPVPLPLSVSLPAGATQGFYIRLVTSTGGPVLYTNGLGPGTLISSDTEIEIREVSGQCASISTPFPGPATPRRWNGTVHYVVPVTPSFQLNQPQASLDINGVQSSGCSPAVVSQTSFSCTPPLPATGNLGFSSTLGAGLFDILISTSALAPSFGGGLTLPGGDILNIDLGGPVLFLNGGTVPALSPLPPAALSIPYVMTASLSVSLQAVVTDPSAPLGLRLSQGSQLDVASLPPPVSISGPQGDDDSVSVDVTAAPTCWLPAGIPFYAVTYTTLHVASNGRVNFVAPDDDWTPAVATATTGNPFIGYWADLSPNVAGSVTISNTNPGFVRVDYAAVPYFSPPNVANTFFIEFESATGIIELGGLQGIQAHPAGVQAFLGSSPGAPGSATDPGAQAFISGASGGPAAPSDMLYDFGTAPTPSLSGTNVNSIIFVPDGSGNYLWFAS